MISHSHLDHCLHPDSYIQLPNGEITKIGEYYNSSYDGISAIDIDNSMKLEDVKAAEKVRIKSPKNMYYVTTKSKRIEVTETHPFFVFDGRKIIVKTAAEVKEGDFVATIKKIDFAGSRQEIPEFTRKVVITDEGRKILRDARIRKGLKQSDVAKSVGSLQVTISEIELGEHFLEKAFVRKLAEFYGLDNFVEHCTRIKFNKSTKIKLPNRTSKELCQFVGYLLGDGDKTDGIKRGKRYVAIRVTDKDRKNLELYQAIAEKAFGLKGRIKEAERKRLIFNSPIMLDFLKSISEHILCKSPYRRIPPLIHKVSKEEVAAFLKGLFDAEGSVGHHQLKLTSTSYDIIQIAQMLLLRFGILSHIYDAENTLAGRRCYQLAISHPQSIVKFYESVGFGSHAKSEALRDLIFVHGIGSGVGEKMLRVPLSGELIMELSQKLGLRKTDLIKIGINYNYYLNGHTPSIEKVKSIIKVFENIAKEKKIDLNELSYIQKVIDSDVLWEPVKKINTMQSDTEYVYDLKVPGHHNYIANGIVVHNCGAVPMLYEYGFDGPLYMTTPALDLATLLWFDYVDVMQKSTTTPLYTVRGIKEAVKHAIPLEYSEVSDIAPDVRLTIQNAGHILGSGLLHFHVGEGMHNIVYALDQKFGRTTLLDPAFTDFQRVETLIMESTYGGAQDIQPNRADTERYLMDVVEETMGRNGIVLIPSFSVERAQEVMAILAEHEFNHPVYLDGMIWDANGIFTAYPEYMGRNMQKRIFQGDDPFLKPIFKRIASQQEREKAWSDKPCVIVSTSGMLTGGPVMQHLHNLAEDPNNTLLFVGYQSEASLGRRIQKGWKELPVSTENGRTATIELKMRVETIDGLSGHSDKNQLLGFVGHLNSKPDRVICVHGDSQKTQELARTINRIFRIPADAPQALESLRLR